MIATYILFIAGFVCLILGANWLVDGATSVGIRAKLSPLIIGLTIVAFGTSLPELIINIFSCARGSSGLAIGNIIGSNIMNVLLILGISSLIFPLDVSRVSIRRDIPVGFFATLMLAFMANDFFIGHSSTLNYVEGLFLLLFGVCYLLLTIRKTDPVSDEVDAIQIPLPWKKTILLLLGGILGLYLGGELVSSNAQLIAKSWGMSETLVGLTVVATATSLPELITSIVAAMKKNAGIAIGNVLGSNILNIFIVLGISSLILPLQFEPQMNIQLLILFVANLLLLLFVFTGKGRRISRVEGSLFIAFYVFFMVYSIATA
jgi:K+-dependent Na+/Ca+ exchanger related-protein